MERPPNHQDAELILKLYDLRREPVMREARKAIAMEFMPASFDDIVALAKFEHPKNAAWRQVASYWEMAYGFCVHGVLHPELLAESGGEGIFLYAKVHPWLAEIREKMSPLAFKNTEWMVNNCKRSKLQFELMTKRLEAMRKG